MDNDLISRSAVLEILTNNIAIHEDEIDLMEEVCYTINAAPAVDAVPVVHARWIDTTPKWITGGQMLPSARLQCSNCGRRTGYRQARTYKYCPKCGARMDGESEEDT